MNAAAGLLLVGEIIPVIVFIKTSALCQSVQKRLQSTYTSMQKVSTVRPDLNLHFRTFPPGCQAAANQACSRPLLRPYDTLNTYAYVMYVVAQVADNRVLPTAIISSPAGDSKRSNLPFTLYR